MIMMNRPVLAALRPLAVVLVLSIFAAPRAPRFAVSAENETSGDSVAEGDNDAAEQKEGIKGKRVWYRLVNITIPPDSPLRSNSEVNKPPKLFLVLKKNGEKIGESTDDSKGWSVDFPHELDNQFPIREGAGDCYTLEVWDDQWSNHLVFNITQIEGKRFCAETFKDGGGAKDKEMFVIYKACSKFAEKHQRAYIVWKRIPAPEKYRKKEAAGDSGQ